MKLNKKKLCAKREQIDHLEKQFSNQITCLYPFPNLLFPQVNTPFIEDIQIIFRDIKAELSFSINQEKLNRDEISEQIKQISELKKKVFLIEKFFEDNKIPFNSYNPMIKETSQFISELELVYKQLLEDAHFEFRCEVLLFSAVVAAVIIIVAPPEIIAWLLILTLSAVLVSTIAWATKKVLDSVFEKKESDITYNPGYFYRERDLPLDDERKKIQNGPILTSKNCA